MLGRVWPCKSWLVGGPCRRSLPMSLCLGSKAPFSAFRCAGLPAGCTPDLTYGAAKLAGPWNVTQAHFCGLAPLPGEGAKRPLAFPA